MRSFKLKALAAALVTTFLLGSSVVMADTTRTIRPGTYLCPGDTISVSSDTWIKKDDEPGQGVICLSENQYRLDDMFEWNAGYGQWSLDILYEGSRSKGHFLYGYRWATGNEHPLFLKCNGGEGTESNPYTFELIYDEDLAITPGTVIYLGESFTLNSDAWLVLDDHVPAFIPMMQVQSGEYRYRHPEWDASWQQWELILDFLSEDSERYVYYGYNYATPDEEPVALMVTYGLGLESDAPLFLELVTPMYRLYNPNSGEHFYTSNPAERSNLISVGWNDEGIGWYAPIHSNTPVYRLYNPNAGEHHYTTDVAERDNLVSLGWNDEGIGWYSDDSRRVPLYRQYNPNEFANNHNYTTSLEENNWLVSLGWQAEDIGWYGVGYQIL